MTRLLDIFKNPMAVIFIIAVFGLSVGVFLTIFSSNKIQISNQTAYLNDKNYQNVIQDLKNQSHQPTPIVFQQNLTQNLATKLAGLMTNGADYNLGNLPPDQAIHPLDNKQINKIFSDFLKTSKPLVIPIITNKDLKITKINSKSAINNYLSDVAAIFNKDLDPKVFDQTSDEVLADAMRTGDFSKALQYMQIYNQLFADLKTVWVPTSWAGIHRQWMQIFNLKSQILAAASQADNDVLRSLVAVNTYKNIFSFEDNLSAQIEGLMKNQRIK